MMKLRNILGVMVMALTITACGGGSDDDRDSSPFVSYTDSPDGEIVFDASGDVFRVTKREGCIWSDSAGATLSWCLANSNTRFDFGDYAVVVTTFLDALGRCGLALAEENSLRLIDIFINGRGFPDYSITDFRAAQC